MPRCYRYDWALFQDWCSATDLDPIPADPLTLAQFLADHPAAPRTQVRRITAINTVHRDHGHPAPGVAPTIRALLDDRRRDHLTQLRSRLAPVIAQLPTHGWPTGVFGRRDAALLMFAGLGYRYQDIARLRRCDVTLAGDVLVVNDVRHLPDMELGVPDVYRRWASVLAFTDTHLNPGLLATSMTAADGAVDASLGTAQQSTGRHSEYPVFVPIDRWGQLPLSPTPLSSPAVAAIVGSHLTGTAAPHAILPVKPGDAVREDDSTTANPIRRLDPESHERGLTARKDAAAFLADVGDVLDGIEDAADNLLRRTLAILDAHGHDG